MDVAINASQCCIDACTLCQLARFRRSKQDPGGPWHSLERRGKHSWQLHIISYMQLTRPRPMENSAPLCIHLCVSAILCLRVAPVHAMPRSQNRPSCIGDGVAKVLIQAAWLQLSISLASPSLHPHAQQWLVFCFLLPAPRVITIQSSFQLLPYHACKQLRPIPALHVVQTAPRGARCPNIP